MRSKRFSLAHFLTLPLIIFTLAAEQSVLAQGKGQPECPDTPAVRPARVPARAPVLAPVSAPVMRRILIPAPQPRRVLAPPTQSGPHIGANSAPTIFSRPPLSQSPWLIPGPIYSAPAPEPPESYSPLNPDVVANVGSGSAATFNLDLTGIDAPERILYTCIRDGRIIYSGDDTGEMCLRMNQDVAGQGVSTIEIQPEGLTPQKQEALGVMLATRQRLVNPHVSLMLSSPGAHLVESSTEPRPAARGGLYESTFKVEREGKTQKLRIFNRVRERLRYFLFELRNLMSSELKYMSAEQVVKKAIADFQKTHPGPKITVELTTEAGSTHWVRIPPLQRLRELWLRS